MNSQLVQKLKDWRLKTAFKEGISSFRVLSNRVIDAIVEINPKTPEELMAIKGIKQKKFEKYGEDLLAIINNFHEPVIETEVRNVKNTAYSIPQYFKLLNSGLRKYQARILAEVSSFDDKGSYLFFSLKDKADDGILPCFMWRRDYILCGVNLEIGMEVIVEGFPEIYERTGRFNFQTQSIELVGEGALKAAYDKLKRKLDDEGLFDEVKKKKIPDFSQKIGVITSRQGAVIEDFLNNLGKHGYQIFLIDSRVEGQRAIKELLSALNRFEKEDLDVLIIIRGGGSMESMMAFDNEILVRRVANYPIPIIAGIGHHKDVPLMALVADVMASTPTATTKILNRSWEEADSNCERYKNKIFNFFLIKIHRQKSFINQSSIIISDGFSRIFNRFNRYQSNIKMSLVKIDAQLSATASQIVNSSKLITDKFSSQLFLSSKKADDYWDLLIRKYQNTLLSSGKTIDFIWRGSVVSPFKNIINSIHNQIDNAENLVRYNDPRRQIALGYSIMRGGGGIIRSIEGGKIGEKINIQTLGGTIDSTIIKINKE